MTHDSEEDDEPQEPHVFLTDKERAKIFHDFMYQMYMASSWTMNSSRMQELLGQLASWGWSHNWGNGRLDNEVEVDLQTRKLLGDGNVQR